MSGDEIARPPADFTEQRSRHSGRATAGGLCLGACGRLPPGHKNGCPTLGPLGPGRWMSVAVLTGRTQLVSGNISELIFSTSAILLLVPSLFDPATQKRTWIMEPSTVMSTRLFSKVPLTKTKPKKKITLRPCDPTCSTATAIGPQLPPRCWKC